MTKITCKRFNLTLIALTVIAHLLSASQSRAKDDDELLGIWEGTLEFASGRGLTVPPTNLPPVRIIVQPSSVRVIVLKNGSEVEVKPNQFRMSKLMTNAVIFAIDSGQDNEGEWVETWSFAVTKKDSSTLIANWVRSSTTLICRLGEARASSH
jgi:hypothetical protein